MSDSYEQMKRLRVQRDQEAAAKTEQTAQASQQKDADEIRQKEILDELIRILHAEGVQASLPLYEDTGITHSLVFRVPRRHNYRFIEMVWALRAGWGHREYYPSHPVLMTRRDLISVSMVSVEPGFHQPPNKGLTYGDGVVLRKRRGEERFVYTDITTAFNGRGGDVRLVDLTDEELACFYLNTVEANKMRR